MEYKEGVATKEDIMDMIDSLKKAYPKPVIVDVRENITPVHVIVEPCSTMNDIALSHLKEKFGDDIIVLDHKQAVEQGLRPNPAFERDPMIIEANPVMNQKLIALKRDDDKPWYDRFQKKRGKKRHR